MSILCLSNDIKDLKTRLGSIFVGYTFDKKPVYARDINAHGAMAVLLRDAIKPNLTQTIEGTPAFIHGGPFANIAQGTNTIIATKTSLALSEYTITEAGFGFDLGGEKFLDIKCRLSGLTPDAVVLVATVRALKYHGGEALKDLKQPNLETLKKGIVNLYKHIKNVKMFNLAPIVAINKFESDSQEELDFIKDYCKNINVPVAIADVWANGGNGAIELAEMVVEKSSGCNSEFKPLYELEDSVESKISAIAEKIYGAKDVVYTPKAKSDIQRIYDLGLENLAVCIAKTHKSLSDNPNLLGHPQDFTTTVREIEIAAGAGFIIPITGDIMRMPGLPETPASENIDMDNDGNITGLF